MLYFDESLRKETYLMKHEKTKNFTLIELMVVLGVILLLVGSMFLVGPAISRKNSEAKTKAIMRNVELLLTNYKAAGNSYPLSVERGIVGNKVAGDPTYMPFFLDRYDASNSGADIGMHKYIADETFADVQIRDNASGCYYILDGFSMPLVYYCADDSEYKLISLGANKLIGTGEGHEYTAAMIFEAKGKQFDPDTGEALNSSEGGQAPVPEYTQFVYREHTEDVGQYFGQGDDIANFTGY